MYTMEYYSAIKRNETELFVVRWMELESVIQSEVSQKEKNINEFFNFLPSSMAISGSYPKPVLVKKFFL